MKKLLNTVIAFLLISALTLTGLSPIYAKAKDGAEIQEYTSTAVPISERYHVTENGYLGKYDLQEGIFGIQSANQVNRNAVYFYSDGYFASSPEIYNPSLATMSLALALSGFNAMQTDFDLAMPNGSYSNLFRHAKALISDIGVEEKDIFINDAFASRPREEGVGMLMGAKKITIDDEGYILLPIVVRGGDYEAEWASNFTLGESGESYGFSSAATQVAEQIDRYINTYKTYDIPSALSKGKVKFWIVGYSRGGAVANITAKRLTDTYGEEGNSIYAYCFEAPQGGVDGTEIEKMWTYNGIYANIHNVLNKNDLVTYLPPKQMGFKRYGVDHYMPGTDAGEIKTTVYETPTGITVTTYSDNEPYTVGEDDYLSRRDDMLKYLEYIDNTVKFSDSFVVGQIKLRDVLSGGNLFVPIEEAKNVSASEWIECFLEDMMSWAANGTYSQGNLTNSGKDKDFRDFYTTNVEFAGKEYATIEFALRNILRLCFTHQHDEEFFNALLYRLLSSFIEQLTVLDIISVVQNWSNLSESSQRSYINKVWRALDGELEYSDGTPVKRISEFVDESERKDLEDSVYTLSAFLFLFLSQDNAKSPNFEGVEATQVHITTLIFNVMTIGQGHFPEVCLAWMSTYDENYSVDNENSKFVNSAVTLINDLNNVPPKAEAQIEVKDNKTVISLSSIIKSNAGVDKNSINNGSAIYFAVYENGKMVGDWQLYRSPIILDTTKDCKYTVKAFATRFEEMGDELILTNDQIRAAEKEPDKNTDSENGTESPEKSNIGLPQLIAAISSAAVCVGLGTILIIIKIRKKQR